MKIRNGFVSNSSSSSFLIYGLNGTFSFTEEASKILYPKYKDDEQSYEEFMEEINEVVDYYEAIDTLVEELNLDTDLEYHHVDYSGGYFGISWDNVQDTETGLQFKTRVKQNLSKIFDITEDEFDTYSEAWFDG